MIQEIWLKFKATSEIFDKWVFKIIKKIRGSNHFWKNALFFCAGVFIIFVGLAAVWVSSLTIPDFHSFENRKVVNSTKIYDRTGEILLYDVHDSTKRTDIPGEMMGINIKILTLLLIRLQPGPLAGLLQVRSLQRWE